jgi:hypothetical protein
MELKCIKEKCNFYFESDKYYEVCKLTSKYCVAGDCIGFDWIKPKMEEIGCNVSRLMKEYSDLESLEDYIRNNQEIEREANWASNIPYSDED